MERLKILFERWWIVLALVASVPFFYTQALANEGAVDYVNNAFFSFWLAGRMIWTGGHPYSSIEWAVGHHSYGATYIPDPIFPYPLPLTLFMAPLGLLSIRDSYILWGTLSQLIVAAMIFLLATLWDGLNRRLFALLILVAVILNGNIHLMVLTGGIGSLFLVFLAAALYCAHRGWNFLSGVLLAFLALKPPLLVIVALIGLWLLLRRNWKMIAGIVSGGLGLLVVGMIQDPGWVAKFQGVGGNLFSLRLGYQPTIISYTRLACGGDLTCALWLYILIGCLLVGAYAWFIWKQRDQLGILPVFSLAIALGVLLPPYLWSYDYVLLVIPLVYISLELVCRTASYIRATLILIAFDTLSLVAVILFWLNPASDALTIQRDMWSIWVGLFVCAVCWWMVFRGQSDKFEEK